MIIAHDSSFDFCPFFINKETGRKSWSSMQGDKYHVTGVDQDGKRFKLVYDKWAWAAGVNLWRGSKWLVRGGRRWLIERVCS